MDKKILLFNTPSKLYVAYQLAGFKVSQVDQQQQNLTIEELLMGKNDQKKFNEQFFSEPMVIFSDLDDAQLDQALFIIKNNGINIALKAIVTDSNKKWSALQLYQELLLEHQYMNKNKE